MVSAFVCHNHRQQRCRHRGMKGSHPTWHIRGAEDNYLGLQEDTTPSPAIHLKLKPIPRSPGRRGMNRKGGGWIHRG